MEIIQKAIAEDRIIVTFDDLEKGAVITVEARRIRIRLLPLLPTI